MTRNHSYPSIRSRGVVASLKAAAGRPQDIPELVEHFMSTRQIGPSRFRVHPDALEALVRYDWPGNVRELANVLERAQILAEDQVITPDDLPEGLVEVSPVSPTRRG